MKTVKIFSDGSCDNHLDKPAMGCGIAVYIEDEYQEDLSRAIHVPAESREEKLTSNVAEWLACIEGMKIAADLNKDGGCRFFFYSDSQVITNQFNGDFYINKPEFRESFTTAHHYAQKAGISKIKWIPRELNEKADELSKLGCHGEDWRNRKKNKRKQQLNNIENEKNIASSSD